MPIWNSISNECKDLIRKMLRPAPKRLDATQVLQHEWLKIPESKTKAELLPQVLTNRLKKFRTYQKVQQAVLTYIATQLSEQEIYSLRMAFIELDKSGDGILSKEEVINALKKSEAGSSLIDIVHALDTNDSGFVDYNGISLQ